MVETRLEAGHRVRARVHGSCGGRFGLGPGSRPIGLGPKLGPNLGSKLGPGVEPGSMGPVVAEHRAMLQIALGMDLRCSYTNTTSVGTGFMDALCRSAKPLSTHWARPTPLESVTGPRGRGTVWLIPGPPHTGGQGLSAASMPHPPEIALSQEGG